MYVKAKIISLKKKTYKQIFVTLGYDFVDTYRKHKQQKSE